MDLSFQNCRYTVNATSVSYKPKAFAKNGISGGRTQTLGTDGDWMNVGLMTTTTTTTTTPTTTTTTTTTSTTTTTTSTTPRTSTSMTPSKLSFYFKLSILS